MKIETKYGINQVVYYLQKIEKEEVCSLCEGSGVVTAEIPTTKEEVEAECPKCEGMGNIPLHKVVNAKILQGKIDKIIFDREGLKYELDFPSYKTLFTNEIYASEEEAYKEVLKILKEV